MDTEFPIIAHGETYVVPTERKRRGGDIEPPHTYDESRKNLIGNIDKLCEQIGESPELYLNEKIICVRLEPKFEAKSYIPTEILRSTSDMRIVGGRRYKLDDKENVGSSETNVRDDGLDDIEPVGISRKAKLYFFRTTMRGICDFKDALSSTHSSKPQDWYKQIASVRSVDLLTLGEKTLGFDEEWQSGSVEAVLHPFTSSSEAAIEMFCDIANIAESEIEARPYPNGATFIATRLTKDAANRVAQINPLRTVHPLGTIELPQLRNSVSAPAPQPSMTRTSPLVKVGVFDGGCDPTVPLLDGYVNAYDSVQAAAIPYCMNHGTGVCGAVLYGELSGKHASDVLPSPEVTVESFRVLSASTQPDPDMYECIDAIETEVKNNPDIMIYNLSLGPKGPILDDDISRFTYALDLLSYKDDGEAPLFCIAAGNDGSLPSPDNRIQSPSDLVNGLCVGAYTLGPQDNPIRTTYSCVGPGREGAKVKPDILEFGGDLQKQFVVVSTTHGQLTSSAGTSFASPLVVHKLSSMMARSEDISPQLARSILIECASHDDSQSREEYGYGFSPQDIDECLNCSEKHVMILYQGNLNPAQLVSLPVYAPSINAVQGNVNISWTIVAICATDPNDSDAYTSSCILDTFVPHAKKYTFTRDVPKKENHVVDLSTPEGILTAQNLRAQGYRQHQYPDSHPAKRYWDEFDLRSKDLKWDTVIHKSICMRGSSLMDPTLTLQSIFRSNENPNAVTRYCAAITIDAQKYQGSLYDAILQQYPLLQPIRLRAQGRIEAQS